MPYFEVLSGITSNTTLSPSGTTPILTREGKYLHEAFPQRWAYLRLVYLHVYTDDFTQLGATTCLPSFALHSNIPLKNATRSQQTVTYGTSTLSGASCIGRALFRGMGDTVGNVTAVGDSDTFSHILDLSAFSRGDWMFVLTYPDGDAVADSPADTFRYVAGFTLMPFDERPDL